MSCKCMINQNSAHSQKFDKSAVNSMEQGQNDYDDGRTEWEVTRKYGQFSGFQLVGHVLGVSG